MIPLFNAIILDVAVVAILIIIIVASVVKGILHTLVNFLLLAGSISLGFAPFMSIVRNPIVDLFASKIVLGAAVSDVVKAGIYVIYPFLASLTLVILIYLLLRMIKLIIVKLIKRREIKDNKLPKRVGTVSRIVGGFSGLILYGVVVIFALSLFAQPIVGGDKTLEEGYVAKHIENLDNMLIELVVDEGEYEKIESKVTINLLLGNLYGKVSDESLEDFLVLSDMINAGTLEMKNLENVKEQMLYLHHFLRFVTTNMLDEKGLEVDGFEKVVEFTRTLSTKVINDINAYHGDSMVPISGVDNIQAISNSLEKLGLKDSAIIVKQVFVNN